MNAKTRVTLNNAKCFFKTAVVLNSFTTALSLITVILYFGTTSLYFKKMNATFAGLYPLLGLLALLPAGLTTVNIFVLHKKAVSIAALSLAVSVIVEHFLLLTYAIGMMLYFFLEGGPYFLAAIGAAIMISLLIAIFKKRRNTELKPFLVRYKVPVAIVCALAFVCVTVFGVFNLLPIYFTSDAVVFAVEDEYQIAWTTSVEATGSVTVGDSVYRDSRAAANRIGKVHKVSVPMSVLDEAKNYTIASEAVMNNRAYLSVAGETVSRSYAFHPVDTSDGLQIYNISDNHLKQFSAARAATYWGDKLDVFVANGDHLNDVSSEYQITLLYRFLHKATDSRVPIIITRGNHEARGRLIENLPDYFGSTRDGKLYYNVKLGDVRFLVLDTGNDDSDGDLKFTPTLNFDDYWREELDWLGGQTVSDEKLVVLCHMAPPMYYDYNCYYNKALNGVFRSCADLLNALDVSLMISGHTHDTEFFPIGDKNNPANYPYVVGSRRNDDLSAEEESFSATQFTGTAVEYKDGIWWVAFTNSKHAVLAEYEFAD